MSQVITSTEYNTELLTCQEVFPAINIDEGSIGFSRGSSALW